jgi:NAD(P)-dependent dehydrogenase (short-subunit alcohol dehydrogenase family)
MSTVLITGCNRGIGFELARLYHERGDFVIGVCRKSSEALDALGIRVIDGVDVGDSRSIGNLRRELGDTPVDVLINNAGILKSEKFGEIDYDQMIEQYNVNTLGPLRVTEALAQNLRKGSKVAIVSSRVGSIDDNESGGNYGYRASKTAVNQVGMNLKHEFEPAGIAVALLHPGYVATDMTGGRGPASAVDAAAGLIARIDELTMDNTGGFWHAEGYPLPW